MALAMGLMMGLMVAHTPLHAQTITAADLSPQGVEAEAADKVKPPVFSLPSGTYGTHIRVTMQSATVGATLHYTLDGSKPTENSPIFGFPLEISGNTTVKAIAVKKGLKNSTPASAQYTLTGNGTSTWNGLTTFNIVNGTKGRWADADVYWAIIGKDWNTDQFVHVDNTGRLVPMALSDNGALVKNGKGYSNYFYSLAQTKSVTIPPINSARIMLSVGSPMYILINTDGNGKVAYAGANIENPDDPNIDVTFDFGEFAINRTNGSPPGIFINTTRVDHFGFPLNLKVTGLDGFSQTVGEPLTESRDQLIASFKKDLPKSFAALAKPPYAPYRIIAPAHATFGAGKPNGDYLDDYVSEVWEQYRHEDLVIDLKNGWKPFTGRVVGDTFRFTDADGGVYFINGKPTTSMVMLGNGLLDDASGGTTDVAKQLQIQTQVCAALNRRVAHRGFSDWWTSKYFYTKGQRANWYAKFWHDHSVNALAYGFSYDDAGNFSPSIHTSQPVSVTYTIGW
ncbi:beta-1,3-glucanase family protein [Ideonella sp. DXS29W]|uniref:Beta-1,3-glucanase family protein n=1 Tax=Ideonella lacteola TaxID=2984193 RepID=A0ABU9BL63_9BURK